MYAALAIAGAACFFAYPSHSPYLMQVMALGLGAGAAYVLLGITRAFDRLTHHMLALVLSIAGIAIGLLFAWAFAVEPSNTPARNVNNAVGYQLTLAFSAVSYLSWRAAALRRIAYKQQIATGEQPAQPPHPFTRGRRLLHGILASAGVGYVMVAGPAALVYLLLAVEGGSEGALLLLPGTVAAVGGVFVLGVLAISFAPVFAVAEWLEWQTRLPYMLWGAAACLLGTAAAAGPLNELPGWAITLVVSLGVVEGLAFVTGVRWRGRRKLPAESPPHARV